MPARQSNTAPVPADALRRTVVEHIADGLSSGQPSVINAALKLLTDLDLAGVRVGEEVDQRLVALPPAWRR
ncbi:hypothetical protein [Kitasatospora sp. MBT66]|uniref:hypothetical protein n=1 Tax=Kitasatospora sp. MBT66 TaxID=1444769 RepID=UPI0005BDDECE|nr:hypothetical protein [Kitasatospora sp. MBT66]